jgi:hypothetical protein
MSKHNIVLVVLMTRGCRTVYQVKLNGKPLFGRVIKSRSKGKITWRTVWNDKSVPLYNPEWLAHRNSRSVSIPLDHPAMSQVKEQVEAQAAADAAAREARRVKRELAKARKLAMAS